MGNKDYVAVGSVLMLVVLSLFILGINADETTEIVSMSIDIDGMSVRNDSNVFLASSSSTGSSGWVSTYFMSKRFSGLVDVAFGFNISGAQPTKARLFSPHNVTVKHSYTCSTEYFNYTRRPKHFWCWRNVSDYDSQTNQSTGSHLELIYEHDFESRDIPTKTAYWTSLKQVDYKDITGIWTPKNYSHSGFNEWFFAKNLNVVAGKMYIMEFWLDIEWTGMEENSGEYCIALKPSGETIQQAITNGHFYMLK